MKKTIFTILVILAVVLGGVWLFGKLKTKKTQGPVQSVVEQVSSEIQNSQAEIKRPPSFQDGDFYLEALKKRDLELCKKIIDEKLKEKCALDIQNILKRIENSKNAKK